MFSCKFCEISKETFFYRTPPVAASEFSVMNSVGEFWVFLATIDKQLNNSEPWHKQ